MLCKKPIFGKHGCGQCLPCRINLRRQKTARILLSAEAYAEDSFLTLTYAEEYVPKTKNGFYTLNYKDVQDFYKRLRHEFSFKHYTVGEYGREGEREFNPHYHAALFGITCQGKLLRPDTGLQCHCDVCLRVEKIWGLGNVTLDELNPQTAGYIAGYCLKKSLDPSTRPSMCAQVQRGRGSIHLMQPFLEELAHVYNSPHGHLMYKHGDIARSVQRGRDRLPLGRADQVKLRKLLDRYEVDPETGEVKYGPPVQTSEIFKALSQSEEVRILSEIQKKHPETSALLLIKARDRDKARRLQRVKNMETRHNIRKQARSL